MSELTPNERVLPENKARMPETDGGPVPLTYESPVDQAKRTPKLHIVAGIFVLTVGFFTAGVGVVFLSAFIFLMVDGLQNNHGTPTRIAGAVYVLGFAGSIFLVARFVRNARAWTERRWFVLGGLIGLGVSMLMEGICFNVN